MTKRRVKDVDSRPLDLSNQDDVDLFFAGFIEDVFGPEASGKTLKDLTAKEREKVLQALAQISGDFTG